MSDSTEPLKDKLSQFVRLSSETSVEAKFIIQVLTSPIYGKMCSRIVHEFSRKLMPLPQMDSENESFSQEMRNYAAKLLLLSVVISNRVIGEDYQLHVQLEYLQHLLYQDSSLNEAQRNSA